jgi:hypothetical protein
VDTIEKAGTFLGERGRAIEQKRFAFHFADGSRDALVEALQRYQNDDGGFGHGLEPDITAPDSNPFTTEMALRICLAAGISGDDPLVQRIADYFEQTQDPDGDWHFAPGVYEHDLAAWFAAWTFPSLNPSCVIAGLLRVFGLGSEQLLARVDDLFQRQSNPTDLLGDQYYAVRPYALYFTAQPNHPQRELYLSGVLWWLLRQDAQSNLPDAGHFFEYVGEPDSFVGKNLPSRIIDEQLDRLQAEQQDDGGWPSPYSPEWRGPSTVDALLTLRAYGRI